MCMVYWSRLEASNGSRHDKSRLNHSRDIPKTVIWAQLGLWGPLEAIRGQTRQTIVRIKVVYYTLGQVRRNRRNLGWQFVIPGLVNLKSKKK